MANSSRKPEEMEATAASMDLILCTSFGTDQDCDKLLTLVANHGKIILLALPESPLKIDALSLLMEFPSEDPWSAVARPSKRCWSLLQRRISGPGSRRYP